MLGVCLDAIAAGTNMQLHGCAGMNLVWHVLSCRSCAGLRGRAGSNGGRWGCAEVA